MNLTEIQKMEDAGLSSERVVFFCGGCGRDNIVHVGIRTFKRSPLCNRCTALGRIPVIPATDPTKSGTHGGRHIKDPELRARRAIKALRTAMHKRTADGKRKPCRSYGCTHKKHSVPKGQRS